MPRRGRRRGDHGWGGGEPEHEDTGGDAAGAFLSTQDGGPGGQAGRTEVFEKTKMCKFFILGCCTRGDACHFAHDKDQLSNLPDLFRTKLCRSLINTGRCDNEDCKYAHSKEELRVVPGFSGTIGNLKIAGDEFGGGAPAGAARPRAQLPGSAQDALPQGRRGGATAAQRSQRPPDAAANRAVAAAMLQQMPTTLPQMEQAARTHMAEAMRLRAMAECLQNATVGTGGLGMPAGMLGASAGTVPAMMPMPMGFGATGVGGQIGMMPAMALQAGGAGGRRTAAGFPGYGQEPAAAVGQTVSPQPADRIIPTLRGESEEAEAPAPATEPVQINPGSLRSLSSNSLAALDPLAEEEPDGAFEERALAQFAAAATMLEPGTPALAPSGVGYDTVEVTQGPTSLGGSSLSWKVKNTFLEYEDPSPSMPLRAVHTAAGRLDMMAGQETPE